MKALLRRLWMVALMGVALMGGAVSAQPLERLAPAETVLALGFRGGGELETSLLRELAQLDWQRAGETLARLAQGDDAAALGDFVADPVAAVASLFEDCPPLAARLRQERVPLLGEEALLAVSMSPFNPLPALTALIRLDEEQAAVAGELQAALLDCVRGEDEEAVLILEQDGVLLYVLGDGGDLPVIIGQLDTLFFVGTNPDVVRGVVRRAGGASEPSLEDRRLSELARSALRDEGFSLRLDFAALAEVLRGLSGMVASPETEPLLQRALALLTTLGGVAGNVSLTDEGVLTEWLSASDPEGGDEALLELLRCWDCQLMDPPFVPETSVSVSGRVLPLERLFDYLQGWLDDATPLLGERLELRALLLEQGFDLDAALFDWFGETVYDIGLEPLSSDIASLLYRPARVFAVEVTSKEAARAGLELWLDALPRVIDALDGLGDGVDNGGNGSSDGADGAGRDDVAGGAAGGLNIAPGGLLGVLPGDFYGASSPFAEVVRESYVERGVSVERYRLGFNVDVAVAFLGGYMLVGSPSYALSQVLEAQGGRAPGPAAYQDARARAPEELSNFHFRDDRVIVTSLADLGSLLSQPLAFALTAGVRAGLANALLSDPDDASGGDVQAEEGRLYEARPVEHSLAPLAVLVPPERLSARLEAASDVYALEPLEPGTRVTVTLESDDFDTFLYLVDADRRVYIGENDDFFGIRMSQLAFTARAGASYWLEVTSYSGEAGGDYLLSLTAAPPATEEARPQALPAAPPPGFADLLQLADLLPQALFILADHLDVSEGYSVLRPEGVYSRSLIRLVR